MRIPGSDVALAVGVRAVVLALIPLTGAVAFAQGDEAPSRQESLLKVVESSLRTKQPGPLPVLAGVRLRGASEDVLRAVRTLRGRRIDVRFDGTSVEDTLAALRERIGLQITTTHRAREALRAAKPRVRLVLRDLPAENVLNLLALHLGKFHFRLRYGVIVLARRDELRPPKRLHVYRVRDLVRPRPHFPAPPLGLATGEDD